MHLLFSFQPCVTQGLPERFTDSAVNGHPVSLTFHMIWSFPPSALRWSFVVYLLGNFQFCLFNCDTVFFFFFFFLTTAFEMTVFMIVFFLGMGRLSLIKWIVHTSNIFFSPDELFQIRYMRYRDRNTMFYVFWVLSISTRPLKKNIFKEKLCFENFIKSIPVQTK